MCAGHISLAAMFDAMQAENWPSHTSGKEMRRESESDGQEAHGRRGCERGRNVKGEKGEKQKSGGREEKYRGGGARRRRGRRRRGRRGKRRWRGKEKTKKDRAIQSREETIKAIEYGSCPSFHPCK